jgi:hypothetical protein
MGKISPASKHHTVDAEWGSDWSNSSSGEITAEKTSHTHRKEYGQQGSVKMVLLPLSKMEPRRLMTHFTD